MHLRFFLIKCSNRESDSPFKILGIKRYLELDFKVEEAGREEDRGFRKPGFGDILNNRRSRHIHRREKLLKW